MFVTFLVILFSNLSFTDVTIQGLLQWYNYHPFAFILAVQDVLLGALILFRLFNEFTAFEDTLEHTHCDHSDEDNSTWIVYTNDSKDKR